MMAKPLPPRHRLLALLRYDARTGLLYWRKRKDSLGRNMDRRLLGKSAGSPGTRGYIALRIDGISYRAHRLIWKILYGTEPSGIDHRNGKTGDNRKQNLREGPQGLNVRNARRKVGKKYPKGVDFHKASGKFRARIRVSKRLIDLGLHTNVKSAHAAYRSAAMHFHGQFARFD
jgi:hypothetical protein